MLILLLVLFSFQVSGMNPGCNPGKKNETYVTNCINTNGKFIECAESCNCENSLNADIEGRCSPEFWKSSRINFNDTIEKDDIEGVNIISNFISNCLNSQGEIINSTNRVNEKIIYCFCSDGHYYEDTDKKCVAKLNIIELSSGATSKNAQELKSKCENSGGNYSYISDYNYLTQEGKNNFRCICPLDKKTNITSFSCINELYVNDNIKDLDVSLFNKLLLWFKNIFN